MTLKPRFEDAPHFRNFWNKGTGKDLIGLSGAQVSFKDFDKFSHLYYEVDQLGDAAAKDTFLKMPFPAAMKLITESLKTDVDSKSLPDSLQEILIQYSQKPTWLDEEVLKTGAELCRKAGVNALMILRDCSLMGGYDFAYLNKPLILTGALKKGAVKRLADTLDFWVNVTRENAFLPNGKGFEYCLRTRLIHSYSRLMIEEKVKHWDTEKWGKPINSWDMLATYMGFSLVFLHGLHKVKVSVSGEAEKGLFHLWKYIGYLIGIPSEYIPNTAKEATEQFFLWSGIQAPADDDSVHLAKSLLDENLESSILKYQFQRKNLRYLHICMNWHFLDGDVNKRLKIPDVRAKNIFPLIVIAKNRIFNRLFTPQKQAAIGHREQMKVLEDYLRTTTQQTNSRH